MEIKEHSLSIAVVLLIVIAFVGTFNTNRYESTGKFLGTSFFDGNGEEGINCGGNEYPESFPSLHCGPNEFDVGRKESCTWCFGCASQPTQNKLERLCNKIRDEGRRLACPSSCPEKVFFGGVPCKNCEQTGIFNIDLTCVIHFGIDCKEKSGNGKVGTSGSGRGPGTGGSMCKDSDPGQGLTCRGNCPDGKECKADGGECRCKCFTGPSCQTKADCPPLTGDYYYDCIKGCCVARQIF